MMKAEEMRILLINSEYPPIGGGASTASANVARVWAADGHKVTVLTTTFENLPARKVESGVQIIRIPSLRRKVHHSNPFEQLIFMLSSCWWALTAGKSIEADVIIAYFGVPCGPAAWLLHKRYDIPFVISLRGSDVPGFRSYDYSYYQRLLSPLIRFLWKQADAVIANSAGLMQLAKKFENKVQIGVIPNGVNSTKFRVEDRQWEPPVILTVGRLVKQKGIDTLIRGLAENLDIDWWLRIIGEGNQKDALEALSTKLGMADRVEFLGWKDRDELLPYYRDANLYVQASLDEGMSNAILEAMSTGLPILASGIHGNSDLVIDGVTGKLVPLGDSSAFSQALRTLLTDKELRERLGSAAKDLVHKDFTWEATADAYLKVFQSIISHRDR